MNSKRIEENRTVGIADFESGQSLIWGRERSVTKITEKQFEMITNELAVTFPEILNYSDYKKMQFFTYLVEEILKFKNLNYVPIREHRDFRKEAHKKFTRREIEKMESEEKARIEAKSEEAIIDYALSPEGQQEIEDIQKEIDSLGTYMNQDEFLEQYGNETTDYADQVFNENYELGKKRYPLLTRLSKLLAIDCHDPEFPAGSIL